MSQILPCILSCNSCLLSTIHIYYTKSFGTNSWVAGNQEIISFSGKTGMSLLSRSTVLKLLGLRTLFYPQKLLKTPKNF